jgi:outer membrane murein-binding lipoprotein Lpp
MKRSLKISSVVATSILLAGFLSSCGAVDQIVSQISEVNLDVAAVEAEIENGVLEQADIYVVATCPDPLSGQVGDVRTCSIEDDYGDTALVDVTIQNTDGDIVWEVQ